MLTKDVSGFAPSSDGIFASSSVRSQSRLIWSAWSAVRCLLEGSMGSFMGSSFPFSPSVVCAGHPERTCPLLGGRIIWRTRDSQFLHQAHLRPNEWQQQHLCQPAQPYHWPIQQILNRRCRIPWTESEHAQSPVCHLNIYETEHPLARFYYQPRIPPWRRTSWFFPATWSDVLRLIFDSGDRRDPCDQSSIWNELPAVCHDVVTSFQHPLTSLFNAQDSSIVHCSTLPSKTLLLGQAGFFWAVPVGLSPGPAHH